MLILLFSFIAALTAYTYTGKSLVSGKRAKEMIKSGKIKAVIDVRTTFEYNVGHYPKAIHIPTNRINRKTTSKLPKKGLLVYCNTGQRARRAAEKLRKLGFTDVYYIAGTYRSLF